MDNNETKKAINKVRAELHKNIDIGLNTILKTITPNEVQNKKENDVIYRDKNIYDQDTSTKLD